MEVLKKSGKIDMNCFYEMNSIHLKKLYIIWTCFGIAFFLCGIVTLGTSVISVLFVLLGLILATTFLWRPYLTKKTLLKQINQVYQKDYEDVEYCFYEDRMQVKSMDTQAVNQFDYQSILSVHYGKTGCFLKLSANRIVGIVKNAFTDEEYQKVISLITNK